jgi:peptide-methionine (S)-S-oxide reductase
MTTATRESGSLATFGGGCFWCLEACFQRLNGVHQVVSGYAGGDPVKANYQAVSTGKSGHAEVVQVTFDPAVIPFEQLMQVYFAIHDPTTLNRQGADVGTQYRSEIFCHDDLQFDAATQFVQHLTEAKKYLSPIVTKISRLDRFYTAEEYHQNYFNANPLQGYCMGVVAPKVSKVESQFPHLLKTS